MTRSDQPRPFARVHAWALLLACWLPLLPSAARGQDEDATTQATTQPAAPITNELRSQRSTIDYFLDSATEPLEGEENREKLADAARCLEQGALDEEVWRADQVKYVRALRDILRELVARGHLTLEELPDAPDADPVKIGHRQVEIVLQRIELTADDGESVIRVWRFPAREVEDAPSVLENINDLLAEESETIRTVEEAQPERPQLRTPTTMVRYFLQEQAATREDPQRYANAVACFRVSDLISVGLGDDAKLSDEQITEYLGTDAVLSFVDRMATVVNYLQTKGLNLDEIPEGVEGSFVLSGPDSPIGVLLNQYEGRWFFSRNALAGLEGFEAEIEETDPSSLDVPIDRSTAAATLNLFFTAVGDDDFDRATLTFDLEEMKTADPAVLRSLAGKLWMILNRYKYLEPLRVQTEVPTDASRYEIMKTMAGRIELRRQLDKDGHPVWLFTPGTLRDIDELYELTERRPYVKEMREKIAKERFGFWALPSLYIREFLVPPQAKVRSFGLQVWQWIGLLLVIAAGFIFSIGAYLIVPSMVRKLLSTRDAVILPSTVRRSLRPLWYLLFTTVLYSLIPWLDLGSGITAQILWILLMAQVVLGILAAYQLIDLGTAFFSVIASRSKSRLDDVLVPLLQKTMKVVAVAVGGIVIANAFGYNVAPLLAGLGVGGLAFGLAAQDTLRNFFGSVNVVLDRPFQVGDWVRMDGTEGTVEAVGLRSTRIRTFYNSQITVPNSNLMTTAIDNMGRRRYRRYSTQIGVTYSTTPEQLEAFCEGIRELIRTHPYTRKDYFHVYVNEFAGSSVNIMLYVFHECPDWGVELQERHRLLVDIMKLASELGVEFAFPTQTVHLNHDRSPDSPPVELPDLPSDAEAAALYGKEQAGRVSSFKPDSKSE